MLLVEIPYVRSGRRGREEVGKGVAYHRGRRRNRGRQGRGRFLHLEGKKREGGCITRSICSQME